MKLIFWGAVALVVLLLISSKCGQSPTALAPRKVQAPPVVLGNPPASAPSWAPVPPLSLPVEAPRPVTYASPRNPGQELPGQVFPAVKTVEIPLQLLNSQDSPSPDGNSISMVQALHLDGAPLVSRRRR